MFYAGALLAVLATGGAADARTVRGQLLAGQRLLYTAVSFRSASDGWVAASGGVILRTTDGGRVWTRYSVPFVADHLQFIGRQTGWASGVAPVGCGGRAQPCHGVIEHTSDGGRRWTTIRDAGPCGQVSSLQFATALAGWALESNAACGAQRLLFRVIRTTNGGSTWRVVFSPREELESLKFVDARNGWAVMRRVQPGGCAAVVLRTSDGGRSWRRQFHIALYCQARVDAIDRRQAWLLATNEATCSMGGCTNNRLYLTVDGGRHWTLKQPATRRGVPRWSGRGGFLSSPLFVTARVGYLPVQAGAGGPGRGGLDITRDGGRHWVRVRPYGMEPIDISPVSVAVAWAVACFPHTQRCPVLLRTTNTGRSWQAVLRPG